MAKKSTARVEAAAPSTVAERRRSIREANGQGPSVKKVVEIDLTKPGARDKLKALHPRPTSETILVANDDQESMAFQYVKHRDIESAAKKAKEIAGNRLCAAIGDNLGVAGVGWKALWDMSNGTVDWAELAKAEGISDETIAKYRKPQSRGLDVKEVAPDEG